MSSVKELEEKVTELLKEIETLKQKEKAEEFGYPFKENEPYEVIIEDGRIVTSCWTNHNMDCERYEQGNVFKTRDEAIRERDKRALLTRFRQFRDKCNGNWNAKTYDSQYYIIFDSTENTIETSWNCVIDSFNLFGYFKNEEDCDRAIELFGAEIKRLWVDE